MLMHYLLWESGPSIHVWVFGFVFFLGLTIQYASSQHINNSLSSWNKLHTTPTNTHMFQLWGLLRESFSHTKYTKNSTCLNKGRSNVWEHMLSSFTVTMQRFATFNWVLKEVNLAWHHKRKELWFLFEIHCIRFERIVSYSPLPLT